MTTIDIDGLSEEEFRRSIESRIRRGLSGKAVEKLRLLLAPFAGPGGILPERFLTVQASDLALGGWDALGDTLRRHDRPGRPVTALSIAFGWPGEDVPQPDGEGRLSPLIETGYYTDDAFPFSKSSREDLLEGYSYHGCTWTGDCEATDTTLWLTGIDDLHGALAVLEAQLLASEEPDQVGIRAGSLGACLLSTLLFQAVEERIAAGGLPRPLCVMAGSNGVYPYFDAPVAGFPAEARKAAELAEDEEVTVDKGVPVPRYSSLLVTGIPRARKRAVLVLEETADEEAARIGRLRGIAHAESNAAAAMAEALGEPPLRSDGSIAAAPDSPLLVKKPSGHAWDFRDMLSTSESEAGPLEDALPGLDQDWQDEPAFEPEQDWGGGSEPEPELGGEEPVEPEPEWSAGPLPEPEQDWNNDGPPEPEPDLDIGAPFVPALPPLPVLADRGGIAPVGPGFSLLESYRLDRQKSLFPLPSFHTVQEVEAAPEPAVFAVDLPLEQPEAAPLVLEEPAAEAEILADTEVEAGDLPEPIAELELEPEPEQAPVDAALPAFEHEPEPEAMLETKPEPAPFPPIAAEPELPAGPLDSGWLQEVEARILTKAPRGEPTWPRPTPVERAPAKGIMDRLRDWWYGRS